MQGSQWTDLAVGLEMLANQLNVAHTQAHTHTHTHTHYSHIKEKNKNRVFIGCPETVGDQTPTAKRATVI